MPDACLTGNKIVQSLPFLRRGLLPFGLSQGAAIQGFRECKNKWTEAAKKNKGKS